MCRGRGPGAGDGAGGSRDTESECGNELEHAKRMSKNNNVNPGQYKVAGRERQGEDIVPGAHKAQLTKAAASRPKRTTNSKPGPRKKR
jgi:hypothetical protein